MKLSIQITPEMRIRLMHAQSLDIEVPDSCVVPEGWQLVPVDVSVEGEWVANYEPNIHYRHEARAEILAILAAAPKPDGGAI
ncbi:hypothetical protein ACET7F_12480 [Aeromonas veronii]